MIAKITLSFSAPYYIIFCTFVVIANQIDSHLVENWYYIKIIV